MTTSRSRSSADVLATDRCHQCRQETPPTARFCPHCGTPLGTDRVPEAAPREVRKTVTAIFCDVVESTAMGERLDAESVRRVMSLYFDAMRHVVERHGGTVEKFIGDAVMAGFWVAPLHEDDALRAVRAAYEMRLALRDLNEEVAGRLGILLQ